MEPKKLRAYFVMEKDAEHGVGVIAETGKEAKRIAIAYDECDLFSDCEYIDIEVRWKQNKNIDGLSKGIVPWDVGLRREIYGYHEHGVCDVCKAEDVFVMNPFSDGRILCSSCEENEMELMNDE